MKKTLLSIRPRQYGKTTTLSLLRRQLNDKYLILNLSFESDSAKSYKDDKEFIEMFYRNVKRVLKISNVQKLLTKLEELISIETFDEFSDFITEFVIKSDKEVILIIDEVDDGTNNEVFLKFLSVLRNKYLRRTEELDYTFKSVILAGITDVKNLKYRIRGDDEGNFNSPWNIAVDFDIDMSFNAEEIKSLLLDYLSEHREVTIDIDVIANRIHYFIA